MSKLQLSDLPENLDEMLEMLETGKVDFSDLPVEAQDFLAFLTLVMLLTNSDNEDLPVV